MSMYICELYTQISDSPTLHTTQTQATVVNGSPQAAINIIQGRNTINDGTPSPFVTQIRASPVGKGMQPHDVAFASVNGASACNTCGFEGDVATEFVGDGASVFVHI